MEIRGMVLKDSERVAALCGQWGYPVQPEDVRELFQRICEQPGHQIFVADFDGFVCGWVHVQGIYSLSSAPYVEIRGIVVDEGHRQQGVGRLLLVQAENWAERNGYQIVRLRSGTQRTEAHHFYPKLGYERTKSQHVYQKTLI